MAGAVYAERPGDPYSPPAEPSALDGWLRERLQRRLTLVVVTPSHPHAGADTLCTGMEAYAELRVAHHMVASPDGSALADVARLDPDVLLLWTALTDAGAQAGGGRRWALDALNVLEGLGLLDRAFVVLIGEGVTRPAARALGYEDGIPADTPLAEVARLVAREAVARDELRRRGSSPPCYL
jgi:hypothetical protein